MEELGKLPGGTGSSALGVSGNGRVVVGRAVMIGDIEPFIWDENLGMRSLTTELEARGCLEDLAGWDLEHAEAASWDGSKIVGWGYNPDGNREAFLADLSSPTTVEIPAASWWGLFVLATLLGGLGAIRSIRR